MEFARTETEEKSQKDKFILKVRSYECSSINVEKKQTKMFNKKSWLVILALFLWLWMDLNLWTIFTAFFNREI